MSSQCGQLRRYRSRNNRLSGDEVNVPRREFPVLEKVELEYDLSRAERPEVVSLIKRRRAVLEFELGKLYLAQGEFARARESFGKADQQGRSWKTQAALGFSRLAPRLMQSLYQHRIGVA